MARKRHIEGPFSIKSGGVRQPNDRSDKPRGGLDLIASLMHNTLRK